MKKRNWRLKLLSSILLFPTSYRFQDWLETEHVYDSTGIQNLKELPKRLGVLGGGNIGLEFAGLYNKSGSQVTVLDAAPAFLPRVQPLIAALATIHMEEDGIQSWKCTYHKVLNEWCSCGCDRRWRIPLWRPALCYWPQAECWATAVGKIQISSWQSAELSCHQHLKHLYPALFAAGDVNGGLQFIATDDFILYSYLAGDGSYTGRP